MAKNVTFKNNPVKVAGPELKQGDAAPDFTCVGAGLEIVNLAKTGNKPRLFSVVPSLDTPVCSQQTKKFNDALASLKDKVDSYTVSLDMPFAQARFCSAEGISNMKNLSDMHNQSFGKNWGTLIEGLPVPLETRSIFIVDKNNKIAYAEYVSEVTNHPDYDKAIAALKQVAG
jgi:thioredoxin-dependent peroxiredoxin